MGLKHFLATAIIIQPVNQRATDTFMQDHTNFLESPAVGAGVLLKFHSQNCSPQCCSHTAPAFLFHLLLQFAPRLQLPRTPMAATASRELNIYEKG